MLSRIASSITAVALALAAQASIPGWASTAIAAPANHKSCKAKSHHHAKNAAAQTAKATPKGGGGAGAQLRRSPDIQILSFGP